MTGILKKKSVDQPKCVGVKMPQGQSETQEVLEKCPYDSNHQIPSDKMAGHISKCREEYKCKKVEKNEELFVLNCKYNYLHRVQAPEIHYHEDRCNDRFAIRSYQLNIKPFLHAYDFEQDLSKYKKDEDELKEMYAGLFIDHFIGSESRGIAVPFSKVLDPARVKPPSGFATTEPVLKKRTSKSSKPSTSTSTGLSTSASSVNAIASTSASSASAIASTSASAIASTSASSVNAIASTSASSVNAIASTSTASMNEIVQTAENDNDDSEEYWNKDSKHPPFNYLDNLKNPKKPLLKFPLGLTKSTRRQYVKWNTKWRENVLKNRGVQGLSLAEERRNESFTNGEFNLKGSFEYQLTPEDSFGLEAHANF